MTEKFKDKAKAPVLAKPSDEELKLQGEPILQERHSQDADRKLHVRHQRSEK